MNHQAFLNMLVQQNTTNCVVTGPSWLQDACAEGSKTDFAYAAMREMAEFDDSAINWKWWSKGSSLDKDNAIMELVDVLHFILSDTVVSLNKIYSNCPDSFIFNKAAVIIQEAYLEGEGISSVYLSEGPSLFKSKNMVESLSVGSLESYWDNFFINVFSITDFKTVEKIFYAKAQLNVFRRQNGYKEGTYIKHWTLEGKEGEPLTQEDNYFVMEFVNSNDVTASQISEFIQSSYDRVKSKTTAA